MPRWHGSIITDIWPTCPPHSINPTGLGRSRVIVVKAPASFVTRHTSHTGMSVDTNLAMLSSPTRDSSEGTENKKAHFRGLGFNRRERQNSVRLAQ